MYTQTGLEHTYVTQKVTAGRRANFGDMIKAACLSSQNDITMEEHACH